MERWFTVGIKHLGLRARSLNPNPNPIRPFAVTTLALVATAGLSAICGAQTIVVRADKVITVTGATIKNGIVVVRDGKIAAVGTGIGVPTGAKVFRTAVVMPGLVDAHSYLGCYNETDEPIDAVTPDIRACDAFDPESPPLRKAIQAGVTTACLAPGNGNVVAGQTAVVRLGQAVQVLNGYAAQKFSISADAAGPQRNPTSRAGVGALARTALGGARNGASASSSRQPSLLVGDFPTSLSERRRALISVCGGRIPVLVHAPTAADVEEALDLAAEFKLKPVLLHSADAWRIAGTLKTRGVPVIVGPLRFRDKDRVLSNAGKLAGAGVKVAFCTDAPLSDPGSLRMTARLAVKYGMGPELAIRALTLGGAEALGIANRTGSIEKGKDGDILLLSGDPLDLTSRIEAVICGGKVVYEAPTK